MQTIIEFAWQPLPNGQRLSENMTLTHGGRYEKDFKIPPQTAKFPCKFPSTEQERQALFMSVKEPMAIQTDAGEIFMLYPNEPIVWTDKSRTRCPIKGNIETLFVTNYSETEQVLQIRVAEREPPAPGSVEVTLPDNDPRTVEATPESPVEDPSPSPLVLVTQ